MFRRLLFIVALGAGAGALAKAGAFLGLLDLEASTTGFLVAVITAAVELLKAYSEKIEDDDCEQWYIRHEEEEFQRGSD